MDSRLARMRSRGRILAVMALTLRAMTLKGKTILFFAGPLYEDLELWYPKIRLEEEGARTVVAGTGEKTYQGKRGLSADGGRQRGRPLRGGLRRPGDPRRLRSRHHAALAEAAPAHPRDLRRGQAGGLHLPRGLGADLGRDRAGQAGHQRRRDQGRPGQRRPALGGQPGGGGRQPDLLAHAGRPAPLHAGADQEPPVDR